MSGQGLSVQLARRDFLTRVGGTMAFSGLSFAESLFAAPDEFVKRTLTTRKEELNRRVQALIRELDQWQTQSETALDTNLHFSQLKAIRILLNALIDKQKTLLSQLDTSGAPSTFIDLATEIVTQIVRSQYFWNFFRNKLQLRHDPLFKDSLWVADTIAWDCYRPTLSHVADLGIVSNDELREPPLCYYTADYSPATWVRGSYPDDMRDRYKGLYRTPVPVIEIPWDHAENYWQFLSLAHEVGHDIEADLKLRQPLLEILESELRSADVPLDRIAIWKNWQAECFADLVGLQLVGPSFTEMLTQLLLLPAPSVVTYNGQDPHPTHYIRILFNATFIRTLLVGNEPAVVQQRVVLNGHADQIEATWKSLYGEAPELKGYLADFSIVFRALMDSKLPALKNRSVRELIPYTVADDRRVRAAVDYLLQGVNPPSSLRPRHVAAAAQLAVTEAASRSNPEDVFRKINERTAKLVRDNGPLGLRAANDSIAHKKFITSFLDRL